MGASLHADPGSGGLLAAWSGIPQPAPCARAGEIAVGSAAGNANGVLVVSRDSAGAAMVDRSFHLTVSC